MSAIAATDDDFVTSLATAMKDANDSGTREIEAAMNDTKTGEVRTYYEFCLSCLL